MFFDLPIIIIVHYDELSIIRLFMEKTDHFTKTSPIKNKLLKKIKNMSLFENSCVYLIMLR